MFFPLLFIESLRLIHGLNILKLFSAKMQKIEVNQWLKWGRYNKERKEVGILCHCPFNQNKLN